VWGAEEMSDLIESVFHNVFVPPILFSVQSINNKSLRVCIDGKQRLTTIYRYMFIILNKGSLLEPIVE
jgi:uncharacterized protein with ParB-like and HNH nuclease domain